jgi:hypothetical protein
LPTVGSSDPGKLAGTGGVFNMKNLGMYSYAYLDPVRLTDPDGNEPTKDQAGTLYDVLTTIDHSSRKMGQQRGQTATKMLLEFGKTNWGKPLVGFWNLKKARYLYTKKGGWIDMTHFFFYAAKALEFKQHDATAKICGNCAEGAITKAVMMGKDQEMTDGLRDPWSAYSYEDLPTDKFGAIFGAQVYDPNSKQTFSQQLGAYLSSLGATDPKSAPNFDQMPANDAEVRKRGTPTWSNHYPEPMFRSDK